MALLDRFRTQSLHKHPDVSVRLAFVEELPLDERELLATVAREDEEPRVRRAAVAKLMDPAALAAVARDDRDESVRAQALAMLRDLALEAFEGTGEAESLAAVDALHDVKTLAAVAKTSTRESVAHQALLRVTEPRALGSIARHAVLEPIRRAAFDAVTDHGELLSIALNSEFKDTAVPAVERLSERDDLEQVGARAKSKSASKRARGLLREMEERAVEAAMAAATAAAAPSPTDPAAAVREARQQVLQQLASFEVASDPQAVEIGLQEAAARWTSIATSSDPTVSESDTDLSERFAEAEARGRARLEELRVEAAARERMQAEAVQLKAAEEQAAREADAAAQAKDLERRRARAGELAQEAEAAVAEEDLAACRRRVALFRREWKDVVGAIESDSEPVSRVAVAEARYAARDADAREADAKARRDGLNRVHQLLGRIEPLLTKADLTLKAADRALRDVRSALGTIPPLPSKRDYDDVQQRLKAAQVALTPKVQELRDIEDWQRWANLGIQEQLCEKMEALRTVEDPEEVARRIHELQGQWRQAADAPRAQGEALWRRFKAVHDELWPRCAAHFAQQAEVRSLNSAKKAELCARAEALADSTAWIQTAEQIKALQAEWKAVGPVTRGQEKEIWERFRAACDRFFTRRQEDLTSRKAMWAENFAKKEALAVRAEALAGSSDWEAAAAEIKRLQVDWKAVGPVKKSRSEAIWQRFRAACDRFFERYALRHEVERGERVAAREAICAELEALAPDEASGGDAPADLLTTVRALRARWQQELAARGVDRERAAALDARFAAGFSRVTARWPAPFVGTDLDPDSNRKRMESLCRRMEELGASLVGSSPAAATAALSPTDRLAAMLKEALAANTIGGKAEDDSRWRAAAEDVRQAQSTWARIGPVPDDQRRTLGERFQRACRRIIEGAGRAAMAAGKGGAPRSA